jgi:hypothetical protein
MKSLQKLNWLFALIFVFANMQSAQSQIPQNEDITWLGMDFTNVKFVGTATQFKEAGEISNSDFRDKYIPAWNELFIKEPKKYNVAEAVRRTEVNYALEVTEKVNNGIKNDFFTNNSSDYGTLTEAKVADLVKKYDFNGKNGVGLMFFVDGMSKSRDEASAWITFVDMKSKKVLYTAHKTGKAGGFGFRNFWAKSFDNILNGVKADVKKSKG